MLFPSLDDCFKLQHSTISFILVLMKVPFRYKHSSILLVVRNLSGTTPVPTRRFI